MRSKNLKLALAVKNSSLSAFHHKVLISILELPFVDVALVIYCEERASLAADPGALAYRVSTAIDTALHNHSKRRDGKPPHDHPIDASAFLDDCKSIHVNCRLEEAFPPHALESIREENIDLIVQLDDVSLSGEILRTPPYGVWAYCPSDNRELRGGPPGYWECVNGLPTSGMTLLQRDEEPGSGFILARSAATTHPYSPWKNFDNMSWQSRFMMRDAVRELYLVGAERFYESRKHLNRFPQCYSKPQCHMPDGKTAFLNLCKILKKLVGEKIRNACTKHFRIEQWCVAYTRDPEHRFLPHRYKKIVPPKNVFWADPFPVEVGDLLYIFVEEYDYATEKGHISCLTIDRNDNLLDCAVIVKQDYHLSYPHIFTHGDKYYMIPESCNNQTVDLYECVDFPHHWQRKQTLIEGESLADATLFYHEGFFWLFAARHLEYVNGHNSECCLWFAEDLFGGEWTPHPQNPIARGERGSRPAGRVFLHNGEIYRPTQNCVGAYGRGIVFKKISELSPEGYAEEEIAELTPEWAAGAEGIHTFAVTETGDNVSVIDFLLKKSRFSA